MDESQLHHEVYIGKRISEFLEDEEIKKVFAEIDKTAVNEWRDGAGPQEPKALSAWYRLSALTSLLNALRSRVNTGNMAARQLETLKNAPKLGNKRG